MNKMIMSVKLLAEYLYPLGIKFVLSPQFSFVHRTLVFRYQRQNSGRNEGDSPLAVGCLQSLLLPLCFASHALASRLDMAG